MAVPVFLFAVAHCLGLQVGVKGANAVVLGVEKKSALQLQDPRTVRKVALLDDHICIAFAGMIPFHRFGISVIDSSFSSYLFRSHRRWTYSDRQGKSGMPVTSFDGRRSCFGGVHHEVCSRCPAGKLCDPRVLVHALTPYPPFQKYTQSGGARPFGISTLIVGFDPEDTTPRLYQTEPSGIYSAWKANAIGRSSKTVREFLEKNYKEGLDKDDAIKLTIKSLLEVVQTGAKNIEITYVDGYNQVKVSILSTFPRRPFS